MGFGLASFLMTSLIVVQEIPHPRSRSFVAQSWVCLSPPEPWIKADFSELVLHPRIGARFMGQLWLQLHREFLVMGRLIIRRLL